MERIEARMHEIVAADQPFVRAEIDAAEALELFEGHRFKPPQPVATSSDDSAGTQQELDGAEQTDTPETDS